MLSLRERDALRRHRSAFSAAATARRDRAAIEHFRTTQRTSKYNFPRASRAILISFVGIIHGARRRQQEVRNTQVLNLDASRLSHAGIMEERAKYRNDNIMARIYFHFTLNRKETSVIKL